MQLYVANCTKQVHDFTYRVLEEPGVKKQKIDPGSQIIVFKGGLSTPQIDDIIGQHRRYGLVAVEEIDRTKPFIGMCYSIDRPISVSKIANAMEHNSGVLDLQGAQLRKEAAVATNATIADATSALQSLEMSVVEEDGKDDPKHKMVSDGVRVEPEGARPNTGRRGRRGKS